MLSRISILCPSRGRPDWAARLVDTAWITALDHDELEFVFYLDHDDPRKVEYFTHPRLDTTQWPIKFLIGDRIVLSECWNRCAEACTGDILFHCGDDIAFRTAEWDLKVREEFDAWPDKLVVVYGDDGIQHERVATHGFYHRRWMETFGYFVPPYFASDFNDLWWTEIAAAAGRLRYRPDINTEHLHPAAGKAPIDQTHAERMARHREQDCDRIWRDTLPQREEDIQKLRDAIAGYTGWPARPA